MTLAESIVEDAALACLESLGYAVLRSPAIMHGAKSAVSGVAA